MKRNELVGCGILFALSLLFIVGSAGITPMDTLRVTSPGAYPLFIACLCLLCALWVTLDIRKQRGSGDAPSWPLFTKEMLRFMGLLLLYYVLMLYFHYTLSTLLFTFFAIWFLARQGWKTSLLVSYVSTFIILLVFKYVFSVVMP